MQGRLSPKHFWLFTAQARSPSARESVPFTGKNSFRTFTVVKFDFALYIIKVSITYQQLYV
jgi:hypothetical protein